MRDIRTVNMAAGQKIESDEVLKRIGDISYRDFGILSKLFLFDSGKAIITGSGFRVEASSGMIVNVPSGLTMQRTSHLNVLPCLQSVAQTVTLDAATGVPRTDMLEGQVISVTNKDDYGNIASVVASGGSVSFSNDPIKRDIKYSLSVQRKTGSTTATAGTAGSVTGLSAIASVDLSSRYLLNLADGEDGSFVEVDCRGATPATTTVAEVISNINAAMGRTIASNNGSDKLALIGDGVGKESVFTIKPPASDYTLDCIFLLLGISTGSYKLTYAGTNEWFKLAEFDIGASTTIVSSGLIRNVAQKSTWASGASDIILSGHLFNTSGAVVTELNADKVDGADVETALTDSTTKIPRSDAVVEALGHINSKILNGAMQVAQEQTTKDFAGIQGDYICDNFQYAQWLNVGHCTVSQDTESPDGFCYSTKVDVTQIDAAIANNESSAINCYVEGFDYASIKDQTVTFGFGVRSSKTGTFCVAVKNNGDDKAYVSEQTIDVANIWEWKTITLTLDQSGGTEDYTNGAGLQIAIVLASGTDYDTTADAWQDGNYYSTTNQDNWFDHVDNDFYITGVRMNLGSTLLPFQHRKYSDVLADCQRYLYIQKIASQRTFAQGRAYAATTGSFGISLPVPMRINTMILTYSTIGNFYAVSNNGWGTYALSALSRAASFENYVRFAFTCATGLTQGHGTEIGSAAAGAYIMLDARF